MLAIKLDTAQTLKYAPMQEGGSYTVCSDDGDCGAQSEFCSVTYVGTPAEVSWCEPKEFWRSTFPITRQDDKSTGGKDIALDHVAFDEETCAFGKVADSNQWLALEPVRVADYWRFEDSPDPLLYDWLVTHN